MRVAVLGSGAGGAAAVVELRSAGHAVSFWGRSSKTLAPFRDQGGVRSEGILGSGLAEPSIITDDISLALKGADCALVCLPTTAHDDVARRLAEAKSRIPVVLNPGHTGGALEVSQVFGALGAPRPPIAEFNTLTYVARLYSPGVVTVTGAAKYVRLASLPGGESAADAASELFPYADRMPDVLACDLANLNMVLHVPGAILGAAWVEATSGDFTFYVQGMTPGVVRVMKALDEERIAVAKAFGHALPTVAAEMQKVGTVESGVDPNDLIASIAGGRANQTIRAPANLAHRYYVEDLGHGLLPFVTLARCSATAVPIASSLLAIGKMLLGEQALAQGRTAERMGIAGLDRDALIRLVRHS